MIEEFRNSRLPSYYSQVSRLSRVVTNEQYDHVRKFFSDQIILHSEKGNALDRDLLSSLVHLLRIRSHDSAHQGGLFATINALRERLEWAKRENNEKAQYFLIYTLGSLLDVAVDTNASKIDHERLRGPLLDLLKRFEDHDEPRLAQAAIYARGALRGISDNQELSDIFWKTSEKIVVITAQTSGSVLSSNPYQLVEAVRETLELWGLFKQFYDTIKTADNKKTKKAMEEMEDVLVDKLSQLPIQSLWYGVLRYTGMLIDAGGQSLDTLEKILPKVPCGDEWQFWCGLYAQLEQGYLQADEQAKKRIVDCARRTFDLESVKKAMSRESRVQEWMKLISNALNIKLEMMKEAPKTRRKSRLSFFKKQQFKPKLDALFNAKIDRHTSTTKGLLDVAWNQCKEAKLFYADAALIKYYTQENRLQIVRISNDVIDIDNCYVNLAVVESSPEGRGQEGFELSLRKRLKVEAPSEGKEIELQDLYKERKLRSLGSGRIGKPKRILIRGRAGVGKTTLCKKIVHDFIHGNLPFWDFNRLLWLPLRKLKGRPSTEEFLNQKIWSIHSDRDVFTPVLLETIFNDKNEKTLLVLDGFDEIVAERDSGEDMVRCRQILNLLNYDNVIITSRPHGIFHNGILPFDLELETVGFRPDQVDVYLTKVVGDCNSVKEIQDFIKSHWLMKGLLQIPIQLDALCYTWNEPFFPRDMKTMTALYQAIELKLWKKDILLQGKMSEAEAANIRTRWSVKAMMSDHIELVQKLAFCGLYNNIVDFSSHHRDMIYRKLPGMANKNDNLLSGLSFFRTADSSAATHGSQIYYFIHLTFQEFFAAHYFVECWISNPPSPLTVVHMDSSECEYLDASEFIQREKYNGRYNIMWRFVAGLLCDENKKRQVQFMQTLDSEPKDLLGAIHLRILMHCFSEISPSSRDCDLKQIAEGMEKGLSEVFDILAYPSLPLLPQENEFPEHLFEMFLSEGTENEQQSTFWALMWRAQISLNLLKKVKNIVVQNTYHESLSNNAITVLAVHCATFPAGIVQVLKHPNPLLRGEARSRLLFWHRSKLLPEAVVEILISGFEDVEDSKPWNGVEVVKKQSTLSPKSIANLESLLEAQRPIVRYRAFDVLWQHLPTRPDILHRFLNFQNPGATREVDATTLGMPDRPEVCDALMILLSDGDKYIRKAAGEGLLSQKALPTRALHALISRAIDDKEEEVVRTAAMEAYSKHCTSTADVFDAIIPFLNDSAHHVRYRASCILSSQPMIPELLIRSFASKLKGNDLDDRFAAAQFFSSQRDLSDEILQSLIPHLHNKEDPDIPILLAQTFLLQSNFPEYAVEPLASLLFRQDLNGLGWVIDALSRSSTLPEDALQYIASSLLTPSRGKPRNYYPAMRCLQQQEALPPGVFQTLLSVLKYRCDYNGFPAEKVLRERDEFYARLPELDRETWEGLFEIWLRKSLVEDYSCVLWGDDLHITTPQGGRHKVELKTPSQKENLRYGIEALREKIRRHNLPSETSESGEGGDEGSEHEGNGHGKSDADAE